MWKIFFQRFVAERHQSFDAQQSRQQHPSIDQNLDEAKWDDAPPPSYDEVIKDTRQFPLPKQPFMVV